MVKQPGGGTQPARRSQPQARAAGAAGGGGGGGGGGGQQSWLQARKVLALGGGGVPRPNEPAVTAAALASEKAAKLAQNLGQLQPFIAVFPQECMGQLAYFGPT